MNMNAINQAKWQRFKNNKRGFWSLIIFSVLFLLSLCSEWIANDKPLLISYQQKLYFPSLTTYPETTFGGQFITETNYRDPYVEHRISENGWAIWPPIKFSYRTINYQAKQPFPLPPSSVNLLGTDDNGRDVVANLLYGFRTAMLFGLTLTLLSSMIGIIAGAIQGYYGGKVDLLGQRFIEIWSAMPMLFIIILLSSIVQPSFWLLLTITVLFSWMTLVSVVRAEFLKTRNFDYVRAAKAMGIKDSVIMYRHILPNAVVATLTYLPFILCGSITTLTSLDFLGFGLPPDAPSLGQLLLQGKMNLNAPWLGISAFLVIAILLSLLIFIGEAIRDAFDPSKAC